MGKQQIATILEKTLEEEKSADQKLTQVSDKVYNEVRRAA
jgi:ferritin-like metal-binding protein YciE